MIRHIEHDVPYLPLPNRVEVILTRELAPRDLTRTAFLLPLLGDGSIRMAVNQRRGLEISGGHIDPGETAEQAAAREGLEEAGIVVDTLIPLGYLRMTSEGSVPPDWKYPHPVGYQQFFTGHIVETAALYVPNDECDSPITISKNQALELLKPYELAFYNGAINLLFSER